MTEQEAKIILEIMTTADGECSCCTRDLFKQFLENFPLFTPLARNVWSNRFALGDLDE